MTFPENFIFPGFPDPVGTLAWVDSTCISAHSRQSERQNIIDRTHTWQQCLITISEGILTKIRLQSRKDCTAMHRQQNEYSGWRRRLETRLSMSRMCECMRRRGRGNSLNVTGANFAKLAEWVGYDVYVYCAKNIADVNVARYHKIESWIK